MLQGFQLSFVVRFGRSVLDHDPPWSGFVHPCGKEFVSRVRFCVSLSSFRHDSLIVINWGFIKAGNLILIIVF